MLNTTQLNSLRRPAARTAAVVACGCAVIGLAVLASPAHESRAQSSAAVPAAQPNYAEMAPTLRHWRQPEVVFHVAPDPRETRSLAEETALVAQGIALWKSKIGSKLTLRMAKGDEAADVEVGFVRAGSLGAKRVGNTKVHFTDPQNDIQAAEIEITEGLPSAQLVQTVAHECGHALGIEGHSDNDGDVMFPSVHTPAAISERDANTLNIAYYRIDTSQRVRGFKRGQKFGTAKSY